MPDWRQIREQHGPLVWGTVYRILANHAEALDCFQDVFTEVLERSSPERIHDWPAFLRWLAARRALNRLRKRQTEACRHCTAVEIATLPAASLGPVVQAEWNELFERVRQEVARLPAQQGEAFWLACIEQLSYAEIGRQMELDANTVGVLVHRARKRLRQVLADLNPVNH
ncbi:MAG TPA: sigma-70 family RNA polymerase sigma factor [Planctomycetaceae bacterium]|jgi:RNA polymerase sigma-70 factor (ECF subfamily)|nr:sigma-70 family RNA polymerase sigma factor [Planctomycetaceae bacterium]